MRGYFLLVMVFISGWMYAQEEKVELDSIRGVILNAANDLPLQNVNIINLNQVKGTITNSKGEFKIKATVNDTLYFTYLGFKPIQVQVTEDWKKYGNVKVKMTEIGFALEEVHLQPLKLTGFLEIDAKNIPIYDDYRYQIGNIDYGYEAGSGQPSGFSRTLSNVFSPFDYLHNVFGNKPRQMKKLREMKKDDEIQRLLENKFDRETLSVLLQVSKDDIGNILQRCNYSKTFIKSANDLQILDALNDCYENYRAVNSR